MKLPVCCELSLATDGASCTFGCGTPIGDDGICPRCRDHSANAFECEACGRRWEDWGVGWETESSPEDERQADLRIAEFHQRMYGVSQADGWYEAADLAKKRARGE